MKRSTLPEIDGDARLWTVPAERMKAQRQHRVPLSDAALGVLERVRGLSEGLVFPGRRAGRKLSDVALTSVLKRLGVPVTVHGMRSTFRDWAEEMTGFSREVKEAALAHTVRDKTERAYRRGAIAWHRIDAGGGECRTLAAARETVRAAASAAGINPRVRAGVSP